MRMEADATSAERRETQLAAIRELMVAEAARGAWLTLVEIAEHTEFGEASISAQLRHLRKECHGNYCVEKRLRRRARSGVTAGYAVGHKSVWEYRVSAPGSVTQHDREVAGSLCDGIAPEPGRDTCRSE